MRLTRRLAVALSGTAASVLLLAGPAFAHVTVHGTDATSGGNDAEITFRVPNENGKAFTTKVEVHLPADAPFAGVFAASKPGWKVVATSVELKAPIVTDDGKITSAVSTVIWTATAGGTGPGQYDDFDIAVGQLPTTKSVTFKVIQTYSDGTVVPWIEVNAPGTTQEPEHPAPELALADAAESGSSGIDAAASSAAPTVAAGAASTPITTPSDDSSTKTLAGVSLGVGILALLLASTGLLLLRRSSKA